MAERSEISWTDATFNWWEGCTKISLGCDGCYAEARNARFAGGQAINWGPGAPRRLTSEHNRNSLRRWNKTPFHECGECGWRGERKQLVRAAGLRCPSCGARGVPDHTRRRVFCSSLSDVLDNEVPDSWRAELFATAEACTELDLYVLTKRIGNAKRMLPRHWLEPGGWPAHIRLGATIVNQQEADRDVPKLLALGCPNFLSMEPLLGAVDLRLGLTTVDERMRAQAASADGSINRMRWRADMLDWVIVGGESGPGARPMHPDRVRSLRDQCEAAGVPFHFKQWGEWLPGQNEPHPTVKDRDGVSPRRVAHHQDGRWGVSERKHTEDTYCTWEPDGTEHRGPVNFHWQVAAWAERVGKKAAGRLLDGKTHDGFPA